VLSVPDTEVSSTNVATAQSNAVPRGGGTRLHCLPALAVATTVDDTTETSSARLLHIGRRVLA
jgi:hypothetical protein